MRKAAILSFLLIWTSFLMLAGGCEIQGFWRGDYNKESDNGVTESQEVSPHNVVGEELNVSPEKPIKGGVTRLEISPFPYPPTEVDLKKEDYAGDITRFTWDGEQISFLLGVSYYNEADVYDLELQIDYMGHREMVLPLELEVEEGSYPRQEFSVSPSVTAGWDEEQVKKEREKIEEARQVHAEDFLVRGSFIWPVENWEEEGYISSEYGAERVINQGEPRRHDGIDIAVEGGTPVVASNSGKVILAKELLSPGKTVILDHGSGLSSSYLHLSKINVEEGEKVSRGEKIGEVGKTGFATGNHLHWSVHVKETPVDPELFLENKGEKLLDIDNKK